MKKSIPKIREREGNEKNPFPKFGNEKGMKKSIPKVRERESEASILGNDREPEFPLTPEPHWALQTHQSDSQDPPNPQDPQDPRDPRGRSGEGGGAESSRSFDLSNSMLNAMI